MSQVPVIKTETELHVYRLAVVLSQDFMLAREDSHSLEQLID